MRTAFLLSPDGDLSKHVDDFKGDLEKYMRESLWRAVRGQEDSFADVSQLVSDKFFQEDQPVHIIQKKLITASRIAVQGLVGEQEVRAVLREHLTSRRHTGALKVDSFRIGYRLFDDQTASVVLTNNTGRILCNCILICQVTVDAGKWAAVKKRKETDALPAYGMMMMPLFGIDPRVVASTAALERARAAYERVNKGSITFVPEWKPGAVLECPLAPLFTVMEVAGSADLSLHTAEGKLDQRVLSLPELRSSVLTEFQRRRGQLNSGR
jgi:hypothetical protein